MAQLQNIKYLRKEDFSKEARDIVDQMASSINPFMQDVQAAFDGQIDTSNTINEIKIFDVIVDTNGLPLTRTSIKFKNNHKVIGTICVNDENLTDNTYVSNTPFISYNLNKDQLIIEHITGLTANKKYRLTIELKK